MSLEYHVYELTKCYSELAFRGTTNIHIRETVYPEGSWFEARQGLMMFGMQNDEYADIKNPFADNLSELMFTTSMMFLDSRGRLQQGVGEVVGAWCDNVVEGCGETLQDAVSDLVANGKRMAANMWY